MKLFDVYPLFDITPNHAKGAYVYDKNNAEYLDLYGGHAVISIGHSHPHYVQKMSNQLSKLGFYSNSIQNPLQVELANKLGILSNCEEYQLFLTNSGAESVENALKMASFHNQRTKVLYFKNAFHGRTSSAVNITDNEKIKAPINKTFETVVLDLNDTEKAKACISKGDLTAVIVEGIQGIGGIHIPNDTFLKEIQKECNATNTVFILDEIQSGFGRSGAFFAFQHAENIKPDLITMAKGMGNGFPVGGLLIHPKFKANYGLLGTTFGGNHLACAATIAVLEVIEKEKLIANALKIGEYFQKELAQINQIKEVRGIGLMIGIEFEFPIKEMRKELIFEEHIFTGSSKDPNTIRLLPPLTIGKKEVDQFITALKKILNK